jgi:hypothetical protein
MPKLVDLEQLKPAPGTPNTLYIRLHFIWWRICGFLERELPGDIGNALIDEFQGPMLDMIEDFSRPSPTMAMDAMPRAYLRTDMLELEGQFGRLRRQYLNGDWPTWANREFEQIRDRFKGELTEFEAMLEQPGERLRVVRLIKEYRSRGKWPGDKTNAAWAKEFHVGERTYERAKEAALKK